MSSFSDPELRYLQAVELLARIATVGPGGTPHVVPTGWVYSSLHDTIDIGGHNLSDTKKFKDVARTGRAAIVIDDVRPPWRARAIEIRGRAEAIQRPTPIIRIHPDRVVSWGLDHEVRPSGTRR